MNRRLLRPLSLALICSLPLSASASITSATIITSSLSPQSHEYKVVGICYWLLCTALGCKVKTSTKVRHYVPDAVVSAYSNIGANPWVEMSPLETPTPLSQAGNDATTNHIAWRYGIPEAVYPEARASPCLSTDASFCTRRLLACR